jgi:SNF2 family DNA or RNA helicase
VAKMVAVLTSSEHVVIPWRDDVKALLPGTERRNIKGQDFALVRHGIIETKLLRNMGMDVPPPILTRYDWAKTKPFDSQKQTAALLSTEPRAYCLSSMGVGKTRAAMYAFDFMRQSGVAKKLLVVAPLSTLVDVWDREVFEAFHHLRAVVLHGTKAQRLLRLKEPADVFIINHDGVAVVADELAAMKFDVVVIDELASFRNARAKRWTVLNELINKRGQPVVWGLTGSPTPNAPTDAYGQVKLLTPNQVPRSMKRFQQDTMTQVSQFRWIPKDNANEIVMKAMKPSIRYTLDQCHDIPETIYSMRHVECSSAQQALYNTVFDKFRAEYKGKEIVAANEGAKLSKLLQISAGFAYNDGKGFYINANDRLKLVVELIEQADKKVIVFASFTWIIHALAQVIENFYTTAIIEGGTTKSRRDEIFASFRNSRDPHVIVAHAGTMAHGLTLVEADTIIWYGPTLSAELYEQANARIRRPGQKSKTHVIHIESTPVEKRAFRRLQSKKKMQGMLLEMFEGEHYE